MKYNIKNDNLSDVFYSIEKQLEKSENLLRQLLEIDYKYSEMKIDLKVFKEILYKFKDQTLDTHEDQRLLINYNGNPYITFNLCVLAVLTKTTIILDCNQNMYGTNSLIIKIINDVLEDFKTDKLIYESITEESIDKTVFIDDINKYNLYKLEKNTNAKFYAYNYIDFYTDSDDFDDIAELIYKYGEDNQIPIESYSELEVIEAVKMIKQKGLGKIVVIITNNEETKQLFKNNIKDKKLYINKNPFEDEFEIIKKEIFYI